MGLWMAKYIYIYVFYISLLAVGFSGGLVVTMDGYIFNIQQTAKLQLNILFTV